MIGKSLIVAWPPFALPCQQLRVLCGDTARVLLSVADGINGQKRPPCGILQRWPGLNPTGKV